MNVAIFTDNDFGKINGVTTTLRAVLDHAPADVEPRIYTCARHAAFAPGYCALASPGIGIPFYREMTMHWPRVGRLLNEVRRDGVDLIHVTTPGPIGLAALSIARELRVPVIGSFHTDLTAYAERLSGSRRLGRLMQRYLRWFYNHCEHVLAPSESTAWLLGAHGVDAARIGLWRRGVDTVMFDPARRSLRLRAFWCVGDDRPAVIYVGRLSKEKGLEHLPAIRTALLRHGVDHRLILAGGGPYRHALEAQLPDAVFLDTLPAFEVARALASADVFVFPSETDSAGNVVLEAQASGLPVVVSDAGGPREYIVDQETGFVCPRGDARAFARVLAAVLRDKRRRQAMGAAARAHALTLGWDQALTPLFDTYRTAVPACPPTDTAPEQAASNHAAA